MVSGTDGGDIHNWGRAIWVHGAGVTNIKGNSQIYSGRYAEAPVLNQGKNWLNCTGNASVFCMGYDYGWNELPCIFAKCGYGNSPLGIKVDTTGYLYTVGNVAVALKQQDDYANNATLTIKKGHFVSRVNKYMFARYDTYDKTMTSTDKSKSTKKFYYMNAYNSITSKDISGCYTYNKNV